MHLETFLAQAFIYLLAAVVSVPVAKRLGMGSVLGYLIAGALIGPFVLGFIGKEGQDVMHFAEFGVVMMLFLVGLELQPKLLWRLRGPVMGMGGAQVLGTGAVIALVGWLMQYPGKQAIAAGLILAMSSTAIALQTLAEKGLMKTSAGQASFAILLFQDLAVIPLLAVLPLLSSHVGAAVPHAEHGSGHSLAEGLPGWQQALLTFGAVALIVGGGRYLIRPIFRYIARTQLREMFTATALLLVMGTALLMQSVGLSAALGTFLAGVVLAESEFRHELESDLEPFKGLLLGIFFIAVGASIDFGLVGSQPMDIALWIAGMILLKGIVLFAVARFSGLCLPESLLMACALSQGGEFCFVLFSVAQSGGALPPELSSKLTAVVALSMAVTPILLLIYEKMLLPRLQKRENEREPDAIPESDNPVLIAGYGRFGHIVGRLLAVNRINATVLDLDSEQVDFLRRMGMKLFYGDASRLDLLHSAGASRAKLFILAIDDEEKSLKIIETVRHNFPHLTILARASGRIHAYEMVRRGAHYIYRETLGSSLDLGKEALRLMGIPAHEAHRAAKKFREFDERSIRNMADVWFEHKDGDAYVNAARDQIAEMEKLFAVDAEVRESPSDEAWDTESLRNEALEEEGKQ
ncbi:Kef-type potassium/proton antiporter (CPA2 family) [Roseimicrobium gellanilyticum]|uniref:Kef-type potassium/proton antiporter (CPA2 family) n=1 Tax=Roseimicrobium gellanilyticum TaxID=748857 RepID=A0A366HLV5_9BACT|nr:monovalent cation:proton antiporter-2 (CPA2) family protein [Roseimicrobium gellanilyticum]RBP43908.1 Kef-type potassium/proton antiporter (CPA2 family) [Roseimicrobium gellanilyticum]